MLRTGFIFIIFFQFQSVLFAAKELILLVNVDTLRYDTSKAYGDDRSLMPNLDRIIKKNGICFDNAFAASNSTRPSVVSFFTGVYPTKHGFWNYRSTFEKGKPNLATMLPEGFKKIFLNANPNTYLLFKDDFDYAWSGRPEKTSRYYPYYHAEYVFEKAKEFLSDANFPEQAFMYIQPADPHGPYHPIEDYPDLFIGDKLKDKYSGRFETHLDEIAWNTTYFEKVGDEVLPKISKEEIENTKNRYSAEVRYLDEHFSAFWKFVNDKYNKILLVFTSDHGESFLDHNDAGHGTSLYNEQIKIPFIIYDTEGRFGKPRHSKMLISNVDVLPTIAEIVGSREDLTTVDGESILKLMEEQDRPLPLVKKRLIVSEYITSSNTLDLKTLDEESRKTLTIRLVKNPVNILIRATIESTVYPNKPRSLYKYIKNGNPTLLKTLSEIKALLPKYYFHHNCPVELYDISKDVYEKDNIISTQPKIADRIKDLSPLKGNYPSWFIDEKPIDDEAFKLLRSLGYVR